MATKRELVELLKVAELQTLVEFYELEPADRRVREDLINECVRAHRVKLEEILGVLSRDRLKDICFGLELDETGREKSVLIERILGKDADEEDDGDEDEEDRDPQTLLATLLGPSLTFGKGETPWPVSGKLQIGDLSVDVDVTWSSSGTETQCNGKSATPFHHCSPRSSPARSVPSC
jgi:hypothetical protein